VKILIVEDNEITRKMVRVTLQAESYEVVEAADAATALHLAPAARPDLILLDLRLPDLDGFDLLSRLRVLPELTDVPVIAVSGFVSRLEEARASAIGFTDFLVKPVQPSELIRVVRAHLPSRPTLPGAGGGGARSCSPTTTPCSASSAGCSWSCTASGSRPPATASRRSILLGGAPST
jgi:DNA-binding response OmpR family regulator